MGKKREKYWYIPKDVRNRLSESECEQWRGPVTIRKDKTPAIPIKAANIFATVGKNVQSYKKALRRHELKDWRTGKPLYEKISAAHKDK